MCYGEDLRSTGKAKAEPRTPDLFHSITGVLTLLPKTFLPIPDTDRLGKNKYRSAQIGYCPTQAAAGRSTGKDNTSLPAALSPTSYSENKILKVLENVTAVCNT